MKTPVLTVFYTIPEVSTNSKPGRIDLKIYGYFYTREKLCYTVTR
jgi:hypothetical protein